MLEKFIKKQFISFYQDEKYKLLIEHIKNKKVLDSYEKEFEEKKELEKFIKEKIEENPQTYISTILLTMNQGVIDSCNREKYLQKDIDFDNVKIKCINNRYSFYASIFDINKLLKEYTFNIDFLYSIFAIIDFIAKERKNRFYVLVLKNYIAILGYENFTPIFSEFLKIEESESLDEEDIIEDIDADLESLEEDIESVDENIEEKLDTITTDIEVKILNHLKDSIKEYYANYSNDFIEKIIILDTIGIDITINSLIEDEILIESEIKEIDLLKTINQVSINEI